MELEKQVVSLENAKRLKELNAHQAGSRFYWYGSTEPSTLWYYAFLADHPDFNQNEIYSAFTVAELGEMLPVEIISDEGVRYDLNIWKSKEGWNVAYWWDEDNRRIVKTMSITFNEKNLADAMARTLISLIEQDLYDPQNIQKTQTTV